MSWDTDQTDPVMARIWVLIRAYEKKKRGFVIVILASRRGRFVWCAVWVCRVYGTGTVSGVWYWVLECGLGAGYISGDP